MELHVIENQSKIKYPVGYNIQDAINFINNVTEVIMQMATEKQFPLKDIDIWVRGSSGAILGGLLCQRLLAIGYENLSVIHIKKEGEESHDNEFYKTNSKYDIVIDDFVASGETMDKISKVAGKYIKYIDLLILSNISVNINFHSDDEEYFTNKPLEIKSITLKHFTPKTLICGKLNKRYNKHLRKLKPTNINKQL